MDNNAPGASATENQEAAAPTAPTAEQLNIKVKA